MILERSNYFQYPPVVKEILSNRITCVYNYRLSKDVRMASEADSARYVEVWSGANIR